MTKGGRGGGGAPAMFVTSYTVGQKDNRTMFPALKNNAAAGYKDPVKIELLKAAGLLNLGTSWKESTLDRNQLF